MHSQFSTYPFSSAGASDTRSDTLGFVTFPLCSCMNWHILMRMHWMWTLNIGVGFMCFLCSFSRQILHWLAERSMDIRINTFFYQFQHRLLTAEQNFQEPQEEIIKKSD